MGELFFHRRLSLSEELSFQKSFPKIEEHTEFPLQTLLNAIDEFDPDAVNFLG